MAAVTENQCENHRRAIVDMRNLALKPLEVRITTMEAILVRIANNRKTWAVLIVGQLMAAGLTLWAAERATSQASDLKPLVAEMIQAMKGTGSRK